MDSFTKQALSVLVGETIKLEDEQGQSLDLRVSKVESGPMDGEKWESFSVVLSSDEPQPIQQGHYYVSHGSLAKTVKFVVPKGLHDFEIMISRQK